MKKTLQRVFFLVVFLMGCRAVSVQAYEQRDLLQRCATPEQLRSMLVLDQKWVTYPKYSDRAGWDRLFGASRAEAIRQGEKALRHEWKVVRASAYMEFERSGNRRVMEDPFNANTQAVMRLFLAELAEGKGRFIGPLIDGVFYLCEMSSWALSAHLVVQPEHRSLPRTDYPVIDLTAGDVSSLLSWIYYYLHDEFDKVNPEISRRLYREIDTRILRPYLENDSFWWMAVNYKGGLVNNWNPWCNSNVLLSFLLLEKDPERLTRAVYRSMQSVDKFLNYVKADGACEEGPSYWGHAPGKALDYLVVLQAATGGKINLFSEPQIRRMGEYISRSYVGDGWVVNFADASARGGGDSHLIYRYGVATGSDELKHFAALLLDGRPLSFGGRDVFRLLEAMRIDADLRATAPVHEVPEFTWYPQTEFCYFHNDRLFFAAKGGYNNESHNHNDAGTFSLWADRVPVFIDAGVGTYTRQTFSSERYSIWTMQSNYHNLPMPNGFAQSFGTRFRARKAEARAGRFSVDLAAAYPAKAGVREWRRSYEMGRNRLVVEDRFELTEALAPNQVNFLTWGKVEPAEGEVTLRVKEVTARLKYDDRRFALRVDTVRLDDPRLSGVWGPEVYRLNFTARQPEKKGKYRFSVEF